MKKILIVVPDGVGVRNYLYSKFVNHLLADNNEIIICHKLTKGAIEEIRKHKPELNKFIEIPNFTEGLKARVLRESLAYARLLQNKKILNNKTIVKFWSPNKKGFKKRVLYFIAEILGAILSKSNKLIKFGDKLFDEEISKSDVIAKNIFEKHKPDVVLNLHQRAPITSPIFSCAKKMQIKTATVIYSWDNIPKARLIFRYDYYFVWSELMKQELELLYKEIKSSQIKITGTPQFEFYSIESYSKDKKSFFKTYGLNPLKKTICFSGNDVTTSPYETAYLEDVCEEVSKIEEENRPQIIFRRCPVDKSSRFDEVINKYKEILFCIDPDWRIDKDLENSFSSIYPAYNDIKLLVNTVYHSDAIINLGSTMAHDAAVLNKPCLYLNYNPVNNVSWNVEDIYNFQHFKTLKDIEAVGWVNNKDEIRKKVILSLLEPNKVGKDRKKWLKRIVLEPLENNSNNIVKAIKECM
ncbi:hypothetical protein [uncultured Polaribacter sp.]|uniref:hypothetical protein n=1 Tax=uncultured Polaribacter sp. TaxID=174711 RepID=UPI002604B23C|nr:hypothetical protein [uncultured Polaribacter sp.]